MRGYDGKLELVGWSDNSRYLASCAGNEVVLWDFCGKGPEGTRPIVLSGHTDRVDSFAWQPGGEHLVSAGRDWRLTLWRPAKAKQPIDVQMLDSRDQRGALVAGWQTRRGRAKRKAASRCSTWSRDESRAARPHARRTQGSAAALRRAREQAVRADAEETAPRSVVAASAPLDGRAFPEGIHPPEGDDQFQRIRAADRLSQRRLRRRVLHREPERAEAAFPPHRQARRRARRAGSGRGWCRIPPACWRPALDVFLIIDSQMRYSVIGGPPEIIEKFEKRFGGARGAAAQLHELRRPDARRRGHRRREVGAGLPAEVVRLA